MAKGVLSIVMAMALGLCLSACASDVSERTPGELFGENQTFSYLDDPEALSALDDADWTALGFDVSSWKQGSGAFGSSKGNLQSLDGKGEFTPRVQLTQYEEDGDNIPVYYLRTTFQATAEDKTHQYGTDIAFDDAVIVSLNGQVVFQGNVPSDGFSKKGYGAAETQSDPIVERLVINGSQLNEGENVLAVELHQSDKTSSDIYFDMGALAALDDITASQRDESVFLGAGGDGTEMLVTWHGTGTDGRVEVAPAPDSDTDEFPQTFQTVVAQPALQNNDGSTTFRATVEGLTPGKTYVYRVVDDQGLGTSATQEFTMPVEGSFMFIVNGDTQLIDADDPTPMKNYERLYDAVTEGKTPSFVLSLGDQADDGADETLFAEVVNDPIFNSVPIAPVVGNHEEGFDEYSHFFMVPNMVVNVDSSGDMSGDYWFERNGTLFLVLNTNESDADVHAEFMREAKDACIQRYGQPTWIVAAFHHSLYSAGNHATSDSILKRRPGLTAALEEIGADVVFSGHDHLYTRTYPLKEGQATSVDDANGVQDTDSIVYFTIGSPTGTKYYKKSLDEVDYAAEVLQTNQPCLSRVDVTDQSLVVSTYALTGTNSVELFDTVTITR